MHTVRASLVLRNPSPAPRVITETGSFLLWRQTDIPILILILSFKACIFITNNSNKTLKQIRCLTVQNLKPPLFFPSAKLGKKNHKHLNSLGDSNRGKIQCHIGRLRKTKPPNKPCN